MKRGIMGGESIELQTVDSGGASIARVLELTEPYHDELTIRVLAPLDRNAGDEITRYYQEHYPKELEIALNSSGNLHNPKLESLIPHFVKAFKSTDLFKNFRHALELHGYKVDEIRYEKFSVYLGKINVAEVNLYCSKVK